MECDMPFSTLDLTLHSSLAYLEKTFVKERKRLRIRERIKIQNYPDDIKISKLLLLTNFEVLVQILVFSILKVKRMMKY